MPLRLLPAALLCALLAAGGAALAEDGHESTPEVRVFYSKAKDPEVQKTLPIAKCQGQKPKVIIPLAVGELRPGDRLTVAGDFDATICLKPHRLYTGFLRRGAPRRPALRLQPGALQPLLARPGAGVAPGGDRARGEAA